MASTFFALNGLVVCGRPHGKHFFCAERFGRLRSYVRPGGAAHMSAGPDEVRRPESLSDLRASSSCLTTGCFWSSVATVSFIASQCACQTSNCDLCDCPVDLLAGRAARAISREHWQPDACRRLLL